MHLGTLTVMHMGIEDKSVQDLAPTHIAHGLHISLVVSGSIDRLSVSRFPGKEVAASIMRTCESLKRWMIILIHSFHPALAGHLPAPLLVLFGGHGQEHLLLNDFVPVLAKLVLGMSLLLVLGRLHIFAPLFFHLPLRLADFAQSPLERLHLLLIGIQDESFALLTDAVRSDELI